MSSCKRGTERNANDYYVTPHWLIREFLPELIFDHNLKPESMDVYDPACGGCQLYEASYPKVLAEFGFENVFTSDIRLDAKTDHIAIDFLKLPVLEMHDLVITNPPFNCSVEFTERALQNTVKGGLVVMLQRLNWLGTKKRKPFWDNAPLKHIYVHHKRPGFDPAKPNKTDSIEYAHFVFEKGYVGQPTLSII